MNDRHDETLHGICLWAPGGMPNVASGAAYSTLCASRATPFQLCIVRRVSLRLWPTVVIQWLFSRDFMHVPVSAYLPRCYFMGRAGPCTTAAAVPQCRSVTDMVMINKLRLQLCLQGSAQQHCAVGSQKFLHVQYSTVTLLVTLGCCKGRQAGLAIHCHI